MKQTNIKISDNFKRMTWRAICSIGGFILIYLVLMGLACLFTVLCGYVGVMLIALKPSFLTFMLGGGLIVMGLLVIFFLVKFIFKKHTVDRTHLVEITAVEEPALFQLIQEIVEEVETHFPKKVYVSPDVNACVFYDSSFWSMFFPVKKNLQIGVGLLNTISADELKAILAHEFGHFSQRSMKVGSYVYNVNQVIYNLLYDNESYEELIQKCASINGYFSFFVSLAVKIIHGIQWILTKGYTLVNLSYMGLSREMEFHADEVAAHVAGSTPLISSLLRMDLADHSYNEVLNYYNSKIAVSVKTDNIYPQQQFIMNFLAKESKWTIEHDLPQANEAYNSRFNQSKLMIKDQWASHPSTQDRIEQLRRLDVQKPTNDHRLASSLLQDKEALQSKLTNQLSESVTYQEKPAVNGTEQFIQDYTQEYRENAFDDLYNGYYDRRNPVFFDVDNVIKDVPENAESNGKELFDAEAMDRIYSAIALENDIATLQQLSQGETDIKSLDYDGQRYSIHERYGLLTQLEKELKDLKSRLCDYDLVIFKHFFTLARNEGKEAGFIEKYRTFFDMDKGYDQHFEVYVKMVNATDFLNYTTPFEIIEQNMATLSLIEADFKTQVEQLLKEEIYQSEITHEIREQLNNYVTQQWRYFNKPDYDTHALQVLSQSMQHYYFLISKVYFKVKKSLLGYQAQLVPQNKLLPI